jgi:oligopeptide transport system substrate-binding protein
MKSAIAAVLTFAAMAAASIAHAQPVLERGNGADPTTLDPQRAITAAEASILRDLYEGLVTYDAGGGLIPGMAADWSISEDRLTYTFMLRGVGWSNGTPVTAEDFIRALQRLVDPETGAPDAPMFAAIAGAEAIIAGRADPATLGVRAEDPFTLVIELSRPEPLLLHLLARPSAMPLHRAFRTVPDIPEATRPFNGAYLLDRYEPGVGLWMVRNDSHYAADDVVIETVVYRGYDRQRARSAFEAGELHINNDLPVFSIEALAEAESDALRAVPFAGSFFLAANVDSVLADASVRLAVALAIDRLRLSEDIWLAAMIPTLSVLPSGLADHVGVAEAALGANEPARRREEARALLAAAGHGDDDPLELVLAISEGELQRQTAAAIADDLAAIGVTLTIIERPAVEHQQAVTGRRDFDLATVGWFGAVGHASEFLRLFVPGDIAVTGFDDVQLRSLLDEAAVTADATARSALYAAADRRLMATLPAIPLMHFESFNLVAPELTGWVDNVVDVHLSRWLGFADAAAE